MKHVYLISVNTEHLVCIVRVESNYYGNIDFQNNARGTHFTWKCHHVVRIWHCKTIIPDQPFSWKTILCHENRKLFEALELLAKANVYFHLSMGFLNAQCFHACFL